MSLPLDATSLAAAAADEPGAAGLTTEDLAAEILALAEAADLTLEEARDAFLEGREEVLADDAVCEAADRDGDA